MAALIDVKILEARKFALQVASIPKRCEVETPSLSIVIDEPAVDARRNANWARSIHKVYEVDPLK